ncbi:hypothetical protein CBS101457_004910 [Exobasidium rhododendri]|nr:hypothetical protein CBS101457_004910 [Exobasidium rhododendri]
MQLDGSGLLAAASTASRTLDFDRLPAMMRSVDLHSNRDPTGLLRQCSLWVTIAFYSGIITLAGNPHQRPFLECTIQDLNDVELFCKRSLEVAGAAQWSDQVSLLQILIFRYRTLRDFLEITCRQLTILEGTAVFPYDEAEACLSEGVSRSYACAGDVLNRLQALRSRLSLPEISCDIYIDYLELETELLHVLCISNFTEACILRIANSYGRPMSMQNFVQRLTRDGRAVLFSSIVGMPKCDLSKKISTLFSNFTSRWSSNRQEQQGNGGHRRQMGVVDSLALPPGHLCAMILINIKSLADHVGGSFQLGSNPRNCLDDREVGLTVQLCRGMADSLRCFSSLQSDQFFQAKGHRDIFRMTAGIAIRTSEAIYEWSATSKGLRSAMQPTLSSKTIPAPTINVASDPSSMKNTTSNTHMPGIADGQDFERLLEEILSTPIMYT